MEWGEVGWGVGWNGVRWPWGEGEGGVETLSTYM